jgi:hypothetical protein
MFRFFGVGDGTRLEEVEDVFKTDHGSFGRLY